MRNCRINNTQCMQDYNLKIEQNILRYVFNIMRNLNAKSSVHHNTKKGLTINGSTQIIISGY